ncbi:MAG: hypothetical protein H7844_06070 [Nitrospirae bacterium YQR-1]
MEYTVDYVSEIPALRDAVPYETKDKLLYKRAKKFFFKKTWKKKTSEITKSRKRHIIDIMV